MSYYREPNVYNPGIPIRSPSRPQFPEYSLWGESSTPFNLYQAPERSIYPQRRADNAPRPYYHSADDHPKSKSHNQRVDRLPWPHFTPHQEERSMNFGNFSPRRDDFTRSPNQFTLQHPPFPSPAGRSNEYSRYPYQPSGQYDKDTHQFLMPTEPPQHQFPSQRSDDHTRSPLPGYNSFMKYSEYTTPQQNQSYRLRSPLQRPNEHTRSSFPTSEMHNSFRLPSPVQRPEHTRSSFPAPEMHNNSRNYDQEFGEDVPQVSIPSKKWIGSPESEPELKLTGVHEPSNKMIPSEPPEDIVIEEIPQPELTDAEEQEEEVVVIERQSLYLQPDNLLFDDEIDDSSPKPEEQISSSSCSSGEWTSNIFKREGSPSRQCDQPSRVLPSRVLPRRQTNTLNKKLIKALSQPVVLEKGAKMMHRMGWIGGGLGKDGTGIVDPIAPNAVYATTTVGFGQEVKAIQRLPTKRESRSPCIKKNKNKKMHNNSFKANVLLHVLKFATNDMQVRLYFDALLKSSERKRVHRIVEAIGNKDSNMQFGQLLRIVEDIRKRCRFTLSTLSDGEDEQRMICVYKEATDEMYLVTPEDCRPCLTDIIVDEEEPNPFLKSIKNHIKAEPEPESPAPSHMIDKLVQLFIEFCKEDAFTEFRFLGAFTKKEITVINYFFTLIEKLSHLCKTDYVVPNKLLGVFDSTHRYCTETDPNGFNSIKKVDISMKQECKKLLAEDGDKQVSLRHPINHQPERFAWRTKELFNA